VGLIHTALDVGLRCAMRWYGVIRAHSDPPGCPARLSDE
jgi:hypothetical protein